MSGLPADIHPDRMAACFATAGEGGLPDALIREPRFAARLTDIATLHYGLSSVEPHDEDEADAVIARLSLQDLDRLARRAGVVVHARAFVREIRGPVLAALGERFGSDALEDARRHATLSFAGGETTDLDGLAQAVEADGKGCLAAWIADLSQPLKKRVLLKWANDAAIPLTEDDDILRNGPTILRQLVVSVEAGR